MRCERDGLLGEVGSLGHGARRRVKQRTEDTPVIFITSLSMHKSPWAYVSWCIDWRSYVRVTALSPSFDPSLSPPVSHFVIRKTKECVPLESGADDDGDERGGHEPAHTPHLGQQQHEHQREAEVGQEAPRPPLIHPQPRLKAHRKGKQTSSCQVSILGEK